MNENPFAPPGTRSARIAEPQPPTLVEYFLAGVLGLGAGAGASALVATLIYFVAELFLLPIDEVMVNLGIGLLWGLLARAATRVRQFVAIPAAAAGLTMGYLGTFCVIFNYKSSFVSVHWENMAALSMVVTVVATITVLPMWYFGSRARRNRQARDAAE